MGLLGRVKEKVGIFRVPLIFEAFCRGSLLFGPHFNCHFRTFHSETKARRGKSPYLHLVDIETTEVSPSDNMGHIAGIELEVIVF